MAFAAAAVAVAGSVRSSVAAADEYAPVPACDWLTALPEELEAILQSACHPVEAGSLLVGGETAASAERS